MSRISTIALTLLLACAGARPGPAAEPLARKLSPGATALGVTRHAVQTVREGEDHASPALAVTQAGAVYVALISLDDGKERVFLRHATSATQPLGDAVAVSAGARAWQPRLAAAADGTVWLAWCGLDQVPGRGTHQRQVFLRRVAPGEPGPRVEVPSADRACAPDLVVSPDGNLHLAWEEWAAKQPGEVRIAYRSYDSKGKARGPAEIVSQGPFDRRPALLAMGDTLVLAWDRLVDTRQTGTREPDYDVLTRSLRKGSWSTELVVDGRVGIQAAPALAPASGGGVLIAYHTGHRFPPVKWWTLRRVRGTTVEKLAARQPAAEREPSGEQQGAEFPALAVTASGGVAVLSRPSQGAYLQILTAGHGLSAPLDLTRRQWGCRGMRADLTFAPDDSLLAVRRARHEVVLERFTFREGVFRSPPTFERVNDPGKPKIEAVRFEPAPADPALGTKLAGQRVFFGDLHMHSAVSDGTGSPDEIYARAYVRGLDFAALTDHDATVGSRMFPSEYDENAWVSDLFDSRDGFATIQAFEWTTRPVPLGYGHRNVYFRGDAPQKLLGLKDGYNDTGRLFAALREERAFAAPHHTSWTGTDWKAHDPAIQRHIEIISVHGASEHKGNQPIASRGAMSGMFAVDGLRKGLRFGFLGGTDSHGLRFHHGIGRKADPWDHGLTGVVAASGARADLWDGMHARHTIATSGARVHVALSAGGVPMGGEGQTASPVALHFAVKGTAPLTQAVILRNGTVVHRIETQGMSVDGTWQDQPTAGSHVYYLRVVQGGDKDAVDVAWSSPVFIAVE